MPLSKAKQAIYFIVDDTSKAVKIGRSEFPQERLNVLQISNPNKMRLVKVISNGGKRMERELHQRFSGARINGEWFQLTQEVQDFIETSPSITPAVIPKVVGVLEGIHPDSEGYYPAWAITSWRQFNGRVRQISLSNYPNAKE